MSRRVVITSTGVVSSLGFSQKAIIDSIKNGRTCFERPDFDDDLIACPVNNFNIKTFTGRFKNARYLNRGAQFCVAAAMAAIKDSGVDDKMLSEAGLFVGTGPNLDISSEFPEIKGGDIDADTLQALFILKFLPNTAASAISGLTGTHGENATLGTACSASLQAVGEAYRKIKHGYLDMALAGGGDSRLSPGALLAYKKAQALHMGDEDPQKAYAPFDTQRKGFVPGEGGAFFLLEELDHAKNRQSKIYGEICGYSSSMDGHNMTAPEPKGKWGEKAVRNALNEASLMPGEIDVVCAHGTGTPLNDAMESALIQRVYGESRPIVIALKSWIGHLAAACGAMEAAILLFLMYQGFLPEIRNLKEPCNKDVNFSTRDQVISFNTAMIESFGFGGQNSALVIKKWMS